MTTNLSASGVAMIEYHVYVALHAAKASSIKGFSSFPIFLLSILHVDRNVFGGQAGRSALH